MKRWPAIATVLLVLGLAGCRADTKWISLFDGSNLADWNTIGNANWKLEDGAVQADHGSGYLVSKTSYGDFRLRVEFWVDENANSGVFIRCSDPQKVGANNAYEVNIFDKRPNQDYRTGAIVDVAKPMSTINAAGRWNTYEITARGSHLTVTLNGVRTVDVEHSGHSEGPIALQYGAGTVKFRSVQITPL
jgi:hypothetical protein